MTDKIRLQILSPSGDRVAWMVNYVSLPATDGSLGILAGHMPMLCALKEGVVSWRFGQNERKAVRVGEGVARVADNEVLLLVSHVKEE